MATVASEVARAGNTGKLAIVPLGGPAGAEILNFEITGAISGARREQIMQAFLDYHVLIFRNQDMSKDAQLAFTQCFGELEQHVIRLRNGERAPLLHVISNLDADGEPTSKPYSHGNYYWHTDKSYHAAPSLMTLLHARELPPSGGDTQFANMEMAYAALDGNEKRAIASLRVEHSWAASRLNTGNRPATEDERRDRPPVSHPLVRTHPDTGRKSLYLGMHTSHVEGMERDAGRELLAELLAGATRDEFVYSHEWQVGDLVLWDNRCLVHRATANYDMDAHRRVLHRTVVKGSVPV